MDWEFFPNFFFQTPESREENLKKSNRVVNMDRIFREKSIQFSISVGFLPHEIRISTFLWSLGFFMLFCGVDRPGSYKIAVEKGTGSSTLRVNLPAVIIVVT